MTLDSLKDALHSELWQILANRLAFEETKRRCTDGEVPVDGYNQLITAITFETLQQNQILSLCRLDDKKNISFRSVSSDASQLGFTTEETQKIKKEINLFNNQINPLKVNHRNKYVGHLDKNYAGNTEIIDFDLMIKSAYKILCLIFRDEPVFQVTVDESCKIDMAASFRNEGIAPFTGHGSENFSG